MRYSVADIEDQIIATLKADTTNFGHDVLCDTFAGQVNPQMFFNPEYMQGFVKLLPFALVSYQGRTSGKTDRDSSGKTYIHTLKFTIYVGAQSRRATQESSRSCYTMNAAVYDDLHGKVPACTPQQLPGYTAMSGKPITTSGFNPQGPLAQAGGQDERLIVNLPGIVVYGSDFQIRLVA